MITLYIPYYGSWPNYFQLYLNSLSYNANVLKVVFITDLSLDLYNLPSNVDIQSLSLDALRLKLQDFLRKAFERPEFVLKAFTPYKLVDFKIFYPLIFGQPDDVFLGYGDIDVIYGNLSQFVRPFENYDIVGGFHGHFTAIRNTSEFKELALKVPGIFELVADVSRAYITDEIAYRQTLENYIKDNQLRMCYLNRTFADVVPKCFYHLFRPNWQTMSKNFFSVHRPDTNIRQINFCEGSLQTVFDNGQVEATSYCHLQKRAMYIQIEQHESRYTITENTFEKYAIMTPKIRLHLPAVPYTITKDLYSHDAFTGKVQRFAPMMRSLKNASGDPIYEVIHYGVEGSESGADLDVNLFNQQEWQGLRIQSLQYINKSTHEEAEKKLLDPKFIINDLSNVGSPLCTEFNRRLKIKLKELYRGPQTDIVCLPLSHTHDGALEPDMVAIETGIGYSGSSKRYRIFESYSWLANSLGQEKAWPNNYYYVIPNFYNTSEFMLSLRPNNRPNTERPKVGFLGRIIRSKGCAVIAEVAKRFPHVDFVLCGQGDVRPFLGPQNLQYKEPIHGTERSDFLGSCIAVLCPTQYLEPFGGSAVEAQLCGTPVVSSDHGAFSETVEHLKTGLRCHTLADFCKGIQLALDGFFDRTYVRQRAEGLYDMYKLAENFKNVFESVLDIHRPEKNGWYSPDCHMVSEGPVR